ncbi:MAG: hypothetical protein IPM33_03615 [Phycisphaerales bacterium]|nr:hypothetical protein [Phycisphaerales bacterium]
MRRTGADTTHSRADAPIRATGDTIAAWLDGCERMLPGSPRERRETRAELDTHLRDRARDLMLAGMNADEAARRAIDELGEASEIAASFRATRADTHRRRIMHGTGIGLAAGAAVVSIAALFQGAATGKPGAETPPLANPTAAKPTLADPLLGEVVRLNPRQIAVIESDADGTPPALEVTTPALERMGLSLVRMNEAAIDTRDATVYTIESEAPALRPPSVSTYMGDDAPSALAPFRMTANFDNTPVKEVFEAMAKASGKGVVVSWAQMDASHAQELSQARLTFAGTDVAMDDVLTQVNLSIEQPVAPLVARPGPGDTIEIVTQDAVDRREVRLTAYDVADLLETSFTGDRSEVSRAARLQQTITQIVHPHDWHENGGNLAQMHYAGGVLFVNAPARHHAKVEWILSRIVESSLARR